MVRAFALLQEQRQEGGEPVVSQASWNQLVRLVQPDISNAHRELLWSVSDDQNQGCIGGSQTFFLFCFVFLHGLPPKPLNVLFVLRKETNN